MNIDSETSVFCLIGNPVYKSLSPSIHNISFKYNNINSTYLTFKVDDLDNAIKGMKALNIKGFNVTMPYKEKILKYIDEIDELAEKIGAVNTVINDHGRLKGFNTDGLGFIKSLEERNIFLNNKKILIIGSGGAGRGIAMTLASKNIYKLFLINRTRSKGEKLVKDIKNNYKNIDVQFIDESQIEDDYDIVINTTSIGMFPNETNIPIDPLIFNKDTIIYDIIYKPRPTLFLKKAKRQGKYIIDGLDMLIYQGLLSEVIWKNEKNDIFSMKKQIKKGLYNIK
ncbi:shikimate dehydrogenase [Clostridium sp. D2Q-14]|uniref:shikimate dehydrogenase n=1 Tax=Anaeromonas gelatinilytica TaxID=2683194 RepID=UPI00193C4E8B|nr:shikimate dehydrogenase [Anaeromonas gelatinilytica]MBS4536181.1 shikimate dehydrogenase [Anaeromonas gelatinilytica]